VARHGRAWRGTAGHGMERDEQTKGRIVLKKRGIVKWFDEKKGYGFISQENGPDVFCHYSAINGNGYKTLEEGQQVEFIIAPSPKGPQAQEVVKL
jgi:CspA family cold shock protein